jgi:hypothetical protein
MPDSWDVEVPIAKVDSDKRLAFGWASVTVDDDGSVLVDKQGDTISSLWELEKAAYTYVLKSRDASDRHTRRGVAELVESMVVTPEKLVKMGLPPDAISPGWWVGFLVRDDAVWQGVKKGDYESFSIGGWGDRA